VADAGAGQADGTGRTLGQVEHASPDEGTTVVDRYDDALATMGHPELGAERQRAVGGGHGVLVEALTGGGPAAGFTAVVRGLSRKAAPGALGADRSIGVQPAAAGCLGLAGVIGMVAMVPGFRGRFGVKKECRG
jgi:threonine dehydratase